MEHAVPGISELFRTRPDTRAELAQALVLVLRDRTPSPEAQREELFNLNLQMSNFGTPATEDFHAAEKADIVRQLVDYVINDACPAPEAVWALAEARDQRAADALICVVTQWLNDPQRDDEAAFQAVFGLADLPRPQGGLLKEVADRGRDRPQQFAQDWLRNLKRTQWWGLRRRR